MDPYLEHPRLWPSVHARFIVYTCDFLQPSLLPRYVASIEERVYVQGSETERSPDLWVRRQKKKIKASVATLEADEPVVVEVPDGETHETYVAILDTHADQKLVSVIEVVSPTNKYAGPGRDSYRAKQREELSSDVHLVEIDLLRTGPHVLAVAERAARAEGPYHYLVCVNRVGGERTKFELYPRTLSQRLPKVRVPLAGDDPHVVLDVQAVLERTYEQGCYLDRIDYDQPCKPPLFDEDQAWVKQMLKEAKRRPPPRNGKRLGSRKRAT
jgi:hypothetical protein